MTTRKVPASSELDAPRLAFSYLRVSDPKQARDGRVGLDRQEESFLPFCERHGLTPSPEALIDKGRSAYHGTHRKKGALGRFIEAAEAGQIPEGSVLVVDDLSRFSRETASLAEELLHRLWKTGCALGVVAELDRVITRDVYDKDDWVGTVLQINRRIVNRDSAEKSRKISDVWQRRQRDWLEHRKPYLGKGSRPEWLSDDGISFVEIEKSVELVQRMFRLCAEGMGGTQIAERLNTEGVKPAKSDAYGPTRILRILHDRRVLGEKQWPDGTISPDYFPKIVDQSLWDACQKAIDQRHDNKGRHGRGEVIANLFQGGTFCACGRALYLQTSRNRQGVVAYAVLRCTGKRKHTCPQPPGDWKYDEEALLLAFMSQRWEKFFDRPADNRQRRALEKQIRELETLASTQQKQADAAAGNLANLLKQAKLEADVASLLGRAVSEANEAVITTKQRVRTLQAELQQVTRRPSGREVQQQIQEQVKAFMSTDRLNVTNRRRFNNWFLSLDVRVTVLDPKLSRLQWDTNDAAIYRDQAGRITIDETLGDMAALGVNGISERLKDIEAERESTAGITGRRRALRAQPPTMKQERLRAEIKQVLRNRETSRAIHPPCSPWPQPEKAWEHVDRETLRQIAAKLSI